MRIISLLVFLLICPPCFATNWVADISCQAAWLMEADVDPIVDSSANTNTGAEAGDPTWSNADPPAAYSVGYEILDGVLDRFDVANDPTLDPGGDFAIVGWVYLVSYGDNSFGRIFDSLDTGDSEGYSFYVNDNDVVDGLSLNIADGALTKVDSDAGCMSLGGWLHVAAVFNDAGNEVAFFVGGVAKGTPAMAKTPVASAVDATIGDRNDNARQFNGRLDELAFFDRTLDSTEINDIMNNGLYEVAAAQVIFVSCG